MKNRRQAIMITALREMCAGKKITALDYAKRYHTTRLGARIFDLREIISESDNAFYICSDKLKDKYGEMYYNYYIPVYSRKSAKILLKKLEGKK